MKVEPREFMNDNQKKGVRPKAQAKRITPGKKILAPVGFAYKQKNDRKVLEIAYVCIKDLDKRKEEGGIFIDNFIISSRMQWKIANLAIGMDYTDAFDDEEHADVQKVLDSNTFIGVFIEKTFNGNPYTDIKYYNRNWNQEKDGDGFPVFSVEEDKLISRGEEDWKNLRKYRASQPEKYGHYEADPLPSGSGVSDEEYEGSELPF